MLKTDANYQKCVKILEEEMLGAMGCTEPIALAYCAAVARKTLGALPDRVLVESSGNIIKNVKSVIVPNTGSMFGIKTAAAAGIVAGNPDKLLEVIADVTAEQQKEIKKFLDTVEIKEAVAPGDLVFDIIVTVYKGDSYAKVRIANDHTNIVLIEKDGKVLESKDATAGADESLTDRTFLTVENIIDFANTVDLADVKALLDREIECNMAIAEEGIKNDWGANVGSVLLDSHPEIANAKTEEGTRLRARAHAAAGSDARMSGCELPVIINSGSGNQGITCSVPIMVYARENGIDDEKMRRALVLSNLLGVYQKSPIGPLSAYCGVISAGTAAVCGIVYLKGGSKEAIDYTIINSLGTASGVICDGAKPSCASKIALAIETAFLAYDMYCKGQHLKGGDGIVKEGVEETVAAVGRLARNGMRQTDQEILHIMVD